MICALHMVWHAQQVISASSSSCLLAHDAALRQERLGQLGKHSADLAGQRPSHPGTCSCSQAVVELAARTATAGPGRVSGAACNPGDLGRVGRGTLLLEDPACPFGRGRTGARGTGSRFCLGARGAGRRSAPPCTPAHPGRCLPHPYCHSHWFTSYTLLPHLLWPSTAAVSRLPTAPDLLCWLYW